MAPKKDTTPSKKKDKYRIRNWRQYNQSLVNRESITFWFDEASIARWYSVERSDKPGRPETYSDDAIRCGLVIKAVFRTALRALQGFVGSIIKILGLDLVCPHYSVFSRRAKGLQIPVRRLLKPGIRQGSRFLARANGRSESMVILSEGRGVRCMLGCAWIQGKSWSALRLQAMSAMTKPWYI